MRNTLRCMNTSCKAEIAQFDFAALMLGLYREQVKLVSDQPVNSDGSIKLAVEYSLVVKDFVV